MSNTGPQNNETQGTSGSIEDLYCPVCGYNLRGVESPRCPECGFAFAWEDMRDPRRRLHPYLFEHHPERNIRSLIHTLWAGLWPPRFWSQLHPLQRVDKPRLVLYWKVSAVTLLVCVLIFIIMMVWQFNIQTARLRAALIPQINANKYYREYVDQQMAQFSFSSLDQYLDSFYPTGVVEALRRQRTILFWTLALTLQVLIWPWISYLSLVNFRQSMKRVDKGRPHVLRCCIYSLTLLTWLAAFSALAMAAWRTLLIFDTRNQLANLRWKLYYLLPSPEMGPAMYALLFAVFACFLLYVAYKRYMQFPDPLATVLASQMLAFLLVLNVMILYVWIL